MQPPNRYEDLSVKARPIAGEHLVEFGDRRARALRMGPDRADDGEKIGAGFDERPAILLRDAADRAARHDRRLAPVRAAVPGSLSRSSVWRHAREAMRREGAARR